MSTRERDNDRRPSRDDDDRGSRRGRDEDEPRRSSRRDEDEDRPRSRARDDDDRGSRRGRDDDRGSRRSSRDDDDDRGSRDRSSGSGSSYRYEGRDPEATKRRAQRGNTDFDKYLDAGIKMYKVQDGVNRLRILPPTWAKPEHYAYDLYMHYSIGADKQSYLCPAKMKGDPCPICEERAKARDDGDEDYAKELEPKRRALAYVVDRDHEKEGVQAWAMPWTLDNDIVKVSQDKQSGAVLEIDHPEDGYDIDFEKSGTGLKTKYEGVAVARRSSPLGKEAWLDYAVDKPLPDQLVIFSYEDIAKAFGGKSSGGGRSRGRDDDRDDGRRNSSRDRDDDRKPSRGREDDDDRGSRGRGRDDDRKARNDDPVAPTWESVHEMTKSELEDLIDEERLDIDAKDAKDTEDLADWVCEEMKLKKSERRERVKDDGEDRPRGRSRDDDEDDKLKRMRESRDDERPRSRRRED